MANTSITLRADTTPLTPGFAFYYNVGLLPQWGTFAALYDEYKFAAVKIKFIPAITVSTPDAPAPLFAYCLDFDDAIVPTSMDTMRQHQDLKYKLMVKPFSVYFKPRFQRLVGTTDSPAGFAETSTQSARGWLDCAETAGPLVRHYGLKLFIEYITPLKSEQRIRMEITYYIMFRGVR